MSDIVGYCGARQAGPMLAEALARLNDGCQAGLAAMNCDGLFRTGRPEDAQQLSGRCGFLHTRAELFSTQATFARTYAGHVEHHGLFVELTRRGSRQLVAGLLDCLHSVRGNCAMLLFHRDYPETIVGANLGLPLYLGFCDEGWFLSTTEWALPPTCLTPMSLPLFSFCVVTPTKYDLYDLQGNHRKDRSYSMRTSVVDEEGGRAT